VAAVRKQPRRLSTTYVEVHRENKYTARFVNARKNEEATCTRKSAVEAIRAAKEKVDRG